MRICEIFESIQGEGQYAGQPALFIRLSGCNLACSWCDTKYHTNSQPISVKELVRTIKSSQQDIVVWTGGEPTLQIDDMKSVINLTPNKAHHLETNGTNLIPPSLFEYVAISPKDIHSAALAGWAVRVGLADDIKVVTDLKRVGVDLIPYATMLMPLSTFNAKKDKAISQKVWNYCVDHKKKYSPRLHIDVWGKTRGI